MCLVALRISVTQINISHALDLPEFCATHPNLGRGQLMESAYFLMLVRKTIPDLKIIRKPKTAPTLHPARAVPGLRPNKSSSFILRAPQDNTTATSQWKERLLGPQPIVQEQLITRAAGTDERTMSVQPWEAARVKVEKLK